MIIYNRKLQVIQDNELQNRIETIIEKQIDFLVTTYGIDKKMLMNKIDDLSVVTFENDSDKPLHKKINGEIKEFNLNPGTVACSGQVEQNYTDTKCFMKNAVFINKNCSEQIFERQFIHELFHYLSNDTEMTFDEKNEAIYKSGVLLETCDMEDNSIYEEARGLNEGITEMLATRLSSQNKGEYRLPVIFAEIIGNNSGNLLIEAYFSKDKNKIQEFYEDFDQRQTSTSSEQLKTIPATNNLFTIDVNLLKGCLEYATSYCRNMEELTAERKRLLPIFKELYNDWNIGYSQANFDVKKLFDSVMSERKNFFLSNKNDSKIFTTDEVGKATINRTVSRTDKALETTNEAQMQNEINIAK